MPLDKLVVSLELSKQMKELGFPQESNFQWVRPSRKLKGQSEYMVVFSAGASDWCVCSAYLSGELGEWLPQTIEIKKPFSHNLIIENPRCSLDGWQVSYIQWDLGIKAEKRGDLFLFTQRDNNFANAFAKMLIHLAKEGIINPRELK